MWHAGLTVIGLIRNNLRKVCCNGNLFPINPKGMSILALYIRLNRMVVKLFQQDEMTNFTLKHFVFYGKIVCPFFLPVGIFF